MRPWGPVPFYNPPWLTPGANLAYSPAYAPGVSLWAQFPYKWYMQAVSTPGQPTWSILPQPSFTKPVVSQPPPIYNPVVIQQPTQSLNADPIVNKTSSSIQHEQQKRVTRQAPGRALGTAERHLREIVLKTLLSKVSLLTAHTGLTGQRKI